MFISKVTVCGYRAAAEAPLECEIPGRFAVLVGPNSGGKTTVCDAIYLAHRKRFPQLPRPSADSLGVRPRQIEVEYDFEQDVSEESVLGHSLLTGHQSAPKLVRSLERDLGQVRSRSEEAPDCADSLLVLTLPAHRYPLDELARREARSLIELLRAEQQRRHNHRNLVDLRRAAERSLDDLLRHSLLGAVEERIGSHLDFLTSGVSHQHSFIGRQRVDDAFLARVLEMLIATVSDRALAQRLELSGLGYVNLLHIAVTLAAIPGDDPLGQQAVDSASAHDPDAGHPADAVAETDQDDTAPGPTIEAGVLGEDGDELSPEEFEEEEAIANEDSFFPRGGLHATVVIEEPEAHLHPQLHRGLVAYLRRTVKQRPEVQVLLTSHSSEIVSSAGPENLVVLRREADGSRVSRPIARLPVAPARHKKLMRRARIHLDANRASTLFAERVVLVEGVTDAMLLRQLGRVWAGNDPKRLDHVEALTIFPIGSKIGEWMVEFLATPGHEVLQRLAILSDTDHRDDASDPAVPAWMNKYPDTRVRRFVSHPTLEPSITPGNETLVERALEALSIDRPAEISTQAIDDLFHGSDHKARFADELAAVIAEAVELNETVAVPSEIDALLKFVTGEQTVADEEASEANAEATSQSD